ncbi:cobalamin-dependent protein [Bacteriovoracaceae bacterium]|nr:cobalamin-dependent protein [Bacteriovoracaceae bacterium]
MDPIDTSIYKKKPRVALLSPQVIGFSDQIRRVQPPLGLAYLAAILEKNNAEDILIYDAAAEGYNHIIDVDKPEDIVNPDSKLIQFGADNKEVIERLKEFKPDVVGISSLFSSQVGCAFRLAEEVKKNFPDVPIVFGGIHASKKFNSILVEKPQVDYIITGEGDFTFTEFCFRWVNNDEPTKTGGLCWLDKKLNAVRANPTPSFIAKMDDLPFPAWHLVNLDLYHQIGMPHNPFLKSREFACIMTSRGCPEKCYFCSSAPFFGHGFRSMSAEKVIEMIHELYHKYGVREFQIEDDTFTLNSVRVVKICEGIADLDVRITLPNAIRADYPKQHDKRLNMFKAMNKAGFAQISVSVEHGNQEFLDKVVGKRLDLKEVQATVDIAHEAGLLVHTNFMMGFPNETAELRQNTIDFMRNLRSDSYSLSLATPLPGTKMWTVVEENNLFMPNFQLERVLYNEVSIIPTDISPQELKNLVVSVNREVNIAAQRRSKSASDKYKLLSGKTASGDRKYSYSEEAEVN